jgi:hypothetical protein
LKKIDIYIGASFIAISISVLVMSASLPASPGLDVGPSFFPRWGSYLLIIISLIHILSAIRSKEESKKPLVIRNVILGIGLTLGYLLLIILSGFYLSTAVFLIVFMWLFHYRKFLSVFLVTTFIVLFIYFAFEWFLHVPLPSGLLI